jgi:ubiquilin
MQIVVKFRSQSLSTSVDSSLSVPELKAHLLSLLALPQTTPLALLRLIVRGHVLQDYETLASALASHGSSAEPPVLDVALASAASPSSSSPLPSANSSHREQLRAMAQNPLMRAVLDDPATLRALITANPQMQNVMQNNPEIASLLNSDSMMRQIRDSLLNPDALAHDRALANINSMPGGAAALERAYQQIGEPMLDSFAPQVAVPDESTAPVDESAPFPNAWSPAAASPATSLFGGRGARPSGGAAAGNPFASLGANPFASLAALQQRQQSQQQQQAAAAAAAAQRLYASQLDLMTEMGLNSSESDRARNVAALIATQGDVDAAVIRVAAQLEAEEERSKRQSAPTVPPTTAQRFQAQIAQLAELGFTDREQCLHALCMCNGNVSAALEMLLNNSARS